MIHHRPKQIYLAGFMGSGKTSVGESLAREIKWPFIDLDRVIESGQGLTIRQIFENSGEPFFREIERAALAEISKIQPAVIALGGGTFVQPANLSLIRETGGTTIWLDCPAEELRERCAQMDSRPLFRDDQSFFQLLQQRLPYYRLADHRIATGGQEPGEVVQKILRLNIW
jgi:shikimate kinase